jgi:DNA polymerase I-like protein with 3'-5' exonuclease and polymerase domains
MPIFSALKQKGLWRGYERHVLTLNPILERISARGMPVSLDRFKEIVARLKADFEAAKARMQELVPYEVKDKKVYKQHRLGESSEKVLPWTPSNKGLLRYIKFRGHKVPTDSKTGKETTSAIEIARLARSTKDPLYATVIGYRKAQTVLANHIKNWEPAADGRVHTTFYFDPATGQLSSRRPNIQNAPRHDDPEFGGYAKIFRSMIAAPAGKTIVEFDFKSFHAQTLAFEAEDADYLRLAKLDIHSYLAAHLVRDPLADRALLLGDQELAEYLAKIKRDHSFVRDYKAKRAILGYGFGMGARKLYEMNRESFNGLRDAQRTIDMLNAAFPRAARWRDEIRQKAHDQGYLLSRHGYIRYFWEVYQWRGGTWKPGDDSEAAIAFLPANDAFGEIKDRILAIAERGLDEEYGLINSVHDSLVFECPSQKVLDCRDQIVSIMTAPSSVLVNSICPTGLRFEVEVKAGTDWGNMKAI